MSAMTAETMNVQMPDGTVVPGVPKGANQADVMRRYKLMKSQLSAKSPMIQQNLQKMQEAARAGAKSPLLNSMVMDPKDNAVRRQFLKDEISSGVKSLVPVALGPLSTTYDAARMLLAGRPKPQRGPSEWESFKADPYAYLLGHSPSIIGPLAMGAVLGKAVPEITPAMKKFNQMREDVTVGKLAEKMPASIEGKPTIEVVKETVPALGLKGSEGISEALQKAKAASMRTKQLEIQLMNRPAAGGLTVAETPVNTSSIGQEIRNSITNTMRIHDSRIVKAMEAAARRYETQPHTLQDLANRLDELNRRDIGRASLPELQATLATHDPRLAFVEEETNAVRNAYYDNLEKLTGEDIRPLKKMSSTLIRFQKAATKPALVEMKEAASAKAHPVLGPVGSLRRKVGKSALLAGAAGAGGYGGYKAARMFTGK